MVKAATVAVDAPAELLVFHLSQNVYAGCRGDTLPQTKTRHHSRQVINPLRIARSTILFTSVWVALVFLRATKLSRVSVKRREVRVPE
jgi:hypothetical protein